MRTNDIQPSDLCPYAVPVLVHGISRTFFLVEVEFPDDHRETVDVAYFGHRLQALDPTKAHA